MPALASVSFPGQSTVKAKNGMEIGHGDESIASKISKAHFSWILKAISYHVSKCNPLAINSHVRPSAALSYQTVKLRCLGTLVCLVLSNFRAPGKQRETRWLAYKQIVPLEVQTRQIEMIEHLGPPNEKNLRNVSPSIWANRFLYHMTNHRSFPCHFSLKPTTCTYGQ